MEEVDDNNNNNNNMNTNEHIQQQQQHVNMSKVNHNIMNEAKDNLNQLSNIPQGHKTVACWNCLSVLVVKDEWNIVECTNCGKFNQIPGEEVPQKQTIEINNNYNHFDVDVPYVFGIITCPFCQKENRFRRDAEHVVCFRCHHSFNVKKAYSSFSNPNTNTHLGMGIAQALHPPLFPINKYPTTNNNNNNVTHSIRFSDMYYPDIMRYRGYYPQPYVIKNCSCDATQGVLKELLGLVKAQNKQYEQQRVIAHHARTPSVVHSYDSLIKLAKDFDEIESRRVCKYKQQYGNEYLQYDGHKDRLIDMYCGRGERDNYRYRNNSLENVNSSSGGKKNEMYRSVDYGLSEKSKSVNRMMFNDGGEQGCGGTYRNNGPSGSCFKQRYNYY
jgi:ribosomal protein L37AE/L43A